MTYYSIQFIVTSDEMINDTSAYFLQENGLSKYRQKPVSTGSKIAFYNMVLQKQFST